MHTIDGAACFARIVSYTCEISMKLTTSGSVITLFSLSPTWLQKARMFFQGILTEGEGLVRLTSF